MSVSGGFDIAKVHGGPVLVPQFKEIDVGRWSHFQHRHFFHSEISNHSFRWSYERKIESFRVLFLTDSKRRWAKKRLPWRILEIRDFLVLSRLLETRRTNPSAIFLVGSPHLWLSGSRSAFLRIYWTYRSGYPGREETRLRRKDLYIFKYRSGSNLKFFKCRRDRTSESLN